MASMPTHALRRARVALRVITRNPRVTLRAYATGRSAGLVNTPAVARGHFFSARTPEPIVAACARRLQAESGRAGGLSVRSTPSRVTTPLLVLGAEDDRAVTPNDVRATARAFDVHAEFFPLMGHDMMLEMGWHTVACRIRDWLTSHGR